MNHKNLMAELNKLKEKINSGKFDENDFLTLLEKAGELMDLLSRRNKELTSTLEDIRTNIGFGGPANMNAAMYKINKALGEVMEEEV